MDEKNSKLNKTHTLIVSDFHMGSRVSRSRDFHEMIKNFNFKKLILLGDIFESLNFQKLKESDWELISDISNLAKEKKVIWVEGNHDRKLTSFFSSLTDIKVCKIYKWKYNNKKYVAIHGHQFDNFLVNNAVLSVVANQIYNFIQLMDFKDRKVSRLIKRKSKGWLRLSKKVAERAIMYAKFTQADYIFCGHTHKAMKKEKGGIKYYNCGCWTDIPCTYVILDKDNIEIKEYSSG
ncbi:MAG: UDP-2,3-diacylglucosamine diphosphatase [Candidatus Moranbacteria bacterium]|jgi:UDP-2,3-diacylglucosamine pyrophosphatase LpxH|nr:UDP-2,3-diacylglucosamine diphosphatase [Candidatus Moranbacteria bacterium]MDD5651772.1 UDP-2,3-diacylglucosamine diphosphatase [Candidatus Moranbacteria bacterium]MDX9855662.1 UDP-2,3-diacylglucosamine diphosphatase [Candidatus Moranbacteria bacterium]